MIKILFICLGNICRSPMAEFMFRDMVRQAGLADEIAVASAATSDEEQGSNIHYGARKKLREMGVPFSDRHARRITRRDYSEYDYLIGMEKRNVSAIRAVMGSDPKGKIYRLLDFSSRPRDIADPWYTGDFDRTWDDLSEGLTALLERLKKELRR